MKICHNSIYIKVFTFKNTLFICLLTWILGLSVDLPNFFEWGGHFFDHKSANCMWNRLASHSFSIFFATTTIFLPCVLIFSCYMRIFFYAFKVKRKVLKSKSLMKSLKITKSLFATFILFSICW